MSWHVPGPWNLALTNNDPAGLLVDAQDAERGQRSDEGKHRIRDRLAHWAYIYVTS